MDKKRIALLKERLKVILQKQALKRGEFILSSGRKSNYYLDGRVITLTPEGAHLVASIILEMVKDKDIAAVGGPSLGADPIAGALAAESHLNKQPINSFIVRKAAKEHGTQRQIEGPAIKAGSRVVIVDDVATTGKAIIEAKEALDKIGVSIDSAIVIVDRQEGAEENLKKAGIRLEPIFKIEEFGV